jgi:hypothetical protein
VSKALTRNCGAIAVVEQLAEVLMQSDGIVARPATLRGFSTFATFRHHRRPGHVTDSSSTPSSIAGRACLLTH